MKSTDHEDPFISQVRRRAERARRKQGVTLWSAIGVVGSVGWLVVVPTLLGVALGRFLDVHFHAGIFWTLSLLTVGLAIGCMAAWRQIQEVMKR